jgi:hypothetical protein
MMYYKFRVERDENYLKVHESLLTLPSYSFGLFQGVIPPDYYEITFGPCSKSLYQKFKEKLDSIGAVFTTFKRNSEEQLWQILFLEENTG